MNYTHSQHISIPYSSIKSRVRSDRPHIVRQFQFHIVRLKETVDSTKFQFKIFQFHRVRLKGDAILPGDRWSIFQFHIVRLKGPQGREKARTTCISIPYSSIKREAVDELGDAPFEFQFHLVRLKVRSRTDGKWHFQFQFHIVRLKEAARVNPYQPSLFQFHIVRLKGPLDVQPRLHPEISIPYSSIKRQTFN